MDLLKPTRLICQRVRREDVFVPLGLVTITVLSYGLLIPWLGFYKDDWRNIWTFHALGVEGIHGLLRHDRPYAGYVWAIACRALGTTPFHWHLFALFARISCVLGAWLTFRAMWPKDSSRVVCVSCLFAVFPGFSQQHYVTLSLGLFQFAVLLLSFAAMGWAIRRNRYRRFLVPLSVLMACHALWQSEYFFGVEVAFRPAIAYVILRETSSRMRSAFKDALVWWAPYLTLATTFVIWRLLFFVPPVGGTYDQRAILSRIIDSPLTTLITYARSISSDFVELTVFAWTETFDSRLFSSGQFYVVTWGVMAMAGIAALSILWRHASQRSSDHSSQLLTLAIGCTTLLGGMSPYWLSFRRFALSSDASRFSFGGMLGASILTYSCLEWLVPSPRRRMTVVVVLVAFAVGFHFRNSNDYRRDWKLQRNMYWQLAWRIPDLEADTTILVDDVPFIDRRSYTIAIPINYLFDGEEPGGTLRHWACNASVDVGFLVPAIEDTTPFCTDYARGFSFDGMPDRSIALTFRPPASLRVVSKSGQLQFSSNQSLVDNIAEFSDLGLIKRTSKSRRTKFTKLFGPEPPHEWSYFFQRAELAAQFDEWQHASTYGDEVRAAGHRPSDASEWLVFLEAYVRTNQNRKAIEIATLASSVNSSLRGRILAKLKRIEKDPSVAILVTKLKRRKINCFWENENHTRK